MEPIRRIERPDPSLERLHRVERLRDERRGDERPGERRRKPSPERPAQRDDEDDGRTIDVFA